jgi:hypothetical protein
MEEKLGNGAEGPDLGSGVEGDGVEVGEALDAQLEGLKACGANPNCHMFVGNSGAQIFSTR